MGSTWRLGRIGGVSVGLHWSWLLFFVVITWSLGMGFPLTFPGVQGIASWVAAAVTAVLFLFSVLGHELAHAWVALARGVPVRGITLFILGGAAEIERDADSPLDEALITAVGPLSSLVFGVGFGALALVSQAVPVLYAVSATMALINISLALFNLIPGFPLDGGRILRAILWAVMHDFVRATRIAARAGQVVGWGMVLLGLAQTVLWRQGFGGLWTAGIGWYLAGMAQASYEQVLLQHALRGLRVGQMMREHFAWVYTGTRVADAWQQYFQRTPQPGLPVLYDGLLVGLVTLGQVRALGFGERLTRKLNELFTTGSLGFYDDLLGDLPYGVVRLMQVPGIGPKRAFQLYNELGVNSAATLAEAARLGEVHQLRGFGPRREAAYAAYNAPAPAPPAQLQFDFPKAA
jgi:Zn-dependent protease